MYTKLIESCKKLIALDTVYDELWNMRLSNMENIDTFNKEIRDTISEIAENVFLEAKIMGVENPRINEALTKYPEEKLLRMLIPFTDLADKYDLTIAELYALTEDYMRVLFYDKEN